MKYKLSELIQGLELIIVGDSDCEVSGICAIHNSMPGHITFLTNPLYKKYLTHTQAVAVILSEKDAADCPVTAIISSNPYYTYSQIAAFFEDKNSEKPEIHPTAVIGNECQIDPSATIGPHCALGDRVKIAAHVVVGAGSFIGNGVEIGEAARLDPRVTLYAKTKIGKRTRISSGVVIGSDGFGFAKHDGAWHKVPQLGCVVIGDDVDIGANTAIDCGAVENTVIGNGVKLDNLIQIGHNVQIGEGSIIAGCVGVAGSAVIGKHCMIGGATNITGHITIADYVMVTGASNVSKSIRESGIYSSGSGGAIKNHEWRRRAAQINRIDSLIERVKALESIVKKTTEGSES